MYNSKFTEAARSSIKKKSTQVCNLQSKFIQQKDSSSGNSGIQSIKLLGKKKRSYPRPSHFQMFCSPTSGKRLEAKAGHLVSKNWWCLFFLKKKCSRQEKGNWDRVLLWERMYKKPVSLIHLAKWALWGYRTMSLWNTFKSDVPKQAFAGTYLNDIFHSL